MGAASSTGSPPGLCRGEPAPWWTALGKAVAARLEFPYRHKLLVLVCAYACVAAIFLCSFMAPSRSATERIGDELPDPDHLADPCTAQDPSQRHLNVQELREERHFDEKYRQRVWDALAPVDYVTERFVLAKNWEMHARPDETAVPVASDQGEAGNDVVMTLQCSPDRLPFVSLIAGQWNGPIAMALYIPAPAHTAAGDKCRNNVLAYLQDFILKDAPQYAVSFVYATGVVPNLHCDLSAESKGFQKPYVDRAAFEKRFGGRPWTDIWKADFPVNRLRTIARGMVRDDAFIFLAESDYMVAPDMHGKLTTGVHARILQSIRDEAARGQRRAMLLPAFERLADVDSAPSSEAECAPSFDAATAGDTCFMYEGYDVPVTKGALKAMVKDGRASVFHEKQFKRGHGCYNPHRFLSSDQPYGARYENPCEPYFIGLSSSLPTFEDRFTGRARDKVAILTHMAAWGFNFTVNPELFLMHLPHPIVVSLSALADDQSVATNMVIAPYTLTHTLLENAAREPQFRRKVAQLMPGFGQVTAKKGAARARQPRALSTEPDTAESWMVCKEDDGVRRKS